ncbi:MAG: DeoR family transcriptional regulator [Candidatus Azambacteria bacterium]|nr:DeoR family transcriptional regulator [Candidatus Azambacteria bacterium]
MEEGIFNTELGRKFLALTKAGLKVSDLIPDLIFREKIKKQILNVYQLFLTRQHPDLLKEIDILDGFFFLAGQMNFIKYSHLQVLRKGVLIFKSRIATPAPAVKKEAKPEAQSSKRSARADRQGKILEKFQNQEKLKLAEIAGLFPDVSEKTVRNDLQLLIGLKKITRNGGGSGSFYQIVR